MRIKIAWSLLFLAVVILDYCTKQGASLYLSSQHMTWQYPFGGLPVFENFFGISLSLNYVENTGAAWGMLSDYTSFLLVLRVALVGYLAWTLFSQNKPTLFKTGVVLILAGAVGNIVDMFFFGHVIDMVKVVLWGYHYPVFNVADMSIVLGLVALLVAEVLFKKESEASSFVQ